MRCGADRRFGIGFSLSLNDVNYTNTNTNVRAHLCEVILTAQTLPLGKKTRLIIKGVGNASEDDLLKQSKF